MPGRTRAGQRHRVPSLHGIWPTVPPRPACNVSPCTPQAGRPVSGAASGQVWAADGLHVNPSAGLVCVWR